MIKEILSISGKPGLFRLVSRGSNMLIVETLDEQKKRIPAYATDRVVAVADISIYTDDGEDTPLLAVFQSIWKEYEGKTVDMNPKKATPDEVTDFFGKVLPGYDRDRVRISDMRKVIAWYNLLVKAGVTDFDIKTESAEIEAEEKPAE